jgi:hypothetical protein
METTLRNIISDINAFIYGGMIQLPMAIAGTFLIIGFFTANYAMLFFLVGFLVLVPLSVYLLLNPGFSFLLGFVPSLRSLFVTKKSDMCGLIPTHKGVQNSSKNNDEEYTQPFSSYVAMMSFFIGYLFTNALSMYTYSTPANSVTLTSTEKKDNQAPVESKTNKKVVTIMAMVLLVILGIYLFYKRFSTKCDTVSTILVSIALFSYFGHGWYLALASMSEERVSDLFGMANRLLPPGAIANGPIACIPF